MSHIVESTDIAIVLSHFGGTDPITFTVTDPRTNIDYVYVLNAGDPPVTVTLENFVNGIWVIPVDADGVDFSQTVEVNCAIDTVDLRGIPECYSGGQLGTGEDTRVLLLSRGGSQVLAELKPESGEFTRVLDDTGTLTLNGVVSGSGEDDCCDGWNEVRAWATEIIVYRDGRDAFCGPVTDVNFEFGRVTVTAKDMTAWWTRRTIPSITFESADLTDIVLALSEEAMRPDPSPNLIIDSRPSGIKSSRRFTEGFHTYAFDAIDEVAKTGLDYTAYGRTIIIRGEDIDPYPQFTLLDNHWTNPPSVRERGDEQATVVTVKGTGVSATAFAPQDYIRYYGYIHRVFAETDLITQSAVDAAAQTRVDLLKDPLYIETPDGASLQPSAPVTLPDLIPGIKVRVDSRSTCRTVVQDFRLQEVKVSLDGSVAISLQPIGTFTEGEE